MAHVTPPATSAEISNNPRAYALLMLLKPDAEGKVDPKELEECIAANGSGEKAPSGTPATLSFSHFAALVSKGPSEGAEPGKCLGWASRDDKGHLSPYSFERHACSEDDVRVQITHSGMCHSDLHQIKNEWGNSTFPMVPGHEIVGIVTEVGDKAAAKHKVGDRVGVGCMVRSCRSCRACSYDDEQFCGKCVFTYNGKDWARGDSATQGGYSTHVVVDKHFVLRIPDALPMAASAPLLCAGVTVWTPLKHYGLDKPGLKIGVLGLGGLGHMAVKFAKAFGAEVTVISTSPSKEAEAISVLGADRFLVSRDAAAMEAAADSLDGIIDTVSAPHQATEYMPLLRYDGKYVLVGAPVCDWTISPFSLLFRRQMVAGSLIGGIKDTQEMLDFCGEHGITCEVEKIGIDGVNEAFVRMLKNDVKYRFVIEVAKTLVDSS